MPSPSALLGVQSNARPHELQRAYEERIAYWTDIQSSVPAREAEAKAMQAQLYEAYCTLMDQARTSAAGLESQAWYSTGSTSRSRQTLVDKDACPRCGSRDNAPGSRYCHCGERLFQTCPNPTCSKELPWYLDRCNNCGTPIDETWERRRSGESVIQTCPNCRNQISWHETTCPKCGADIEEELERQAALESQRQQAMQREKERQAQEDERISSLLANWPWHLRRYMKTLSITDREALRLEISRYREQHGIRKPLFWQGWFVAVCIVGGLALPFLWPLAAIVWILDPEASSLARALGWGCLITFAFALVLTCVLSVMMGIVAFSG